MVDAPSIKLLQTIAFKKRFIGRPSWGEQLGRGARRRQGRRVAI
jgi:hypothetical protein